MENPTKDGYAFKATSIDLDISCNDSLCLLNNVLLIGTFPFLFPNNTGKMKKIKLYFEKKISQMTTKLFLEQRLLWLAAVLYFFLSEEGILKLARWGAIYPLRFMLYYTVPDCRKERYGEIIDALSRNEWINAWQLCSILIKILMKRMYKIIGKFHLLLIWLD